DMAPGRSGSTTRAPWQRARQSNARLTSTAATRWTTPLRSWCAPRPAPAGSASTDSPPPTSCSPSFRRDMRRNKKPSAMFTAARRVPTHDDEGAFMFSVHSRLLRLLPVLALGILAVNVQAQSFRVQCPAGTVLHPANTGGNATYDTITRPLDTNGATNPTGTKNIAGKLNP